MRKIKEYPKFYSSHLEIDIRYYCFKASNKFYIWKRYMEITIIIKKLERVRDFKKVSPFNQINYTKIRICKESVNLLFQNPRRNMTFIMYSIII